MEALGHRYWPRKSKFTISRRESFKKSGHELSKGKYDVIMTSFDHYVIEKSSYYVIFLGFGWILDGLSTGCKDFICLRNHKWSTWFKLGKFYRTSRISPKNRRLDAVDLTSIDPIWPRNFRKNCLGAQFTILFLTKKIKQIWNHCFEAWTTRIWRHLKVKCHES